MVRALPEVRRRRALGEHLTPEQMVRRFILPEILPLRWKYRWVDLFAGEGNILFPLLNEVPPRERCRFFAEHVFMYDIQRDMVERARARAVEMGIPAEVVSRNIRQADTLERFPQELQGPGRPIYHVTNPPYLYLGYIVKHPETRDHLKYFRGANEGLQDLYQVALAADLRAGIPRMIYIIPANFLFGASCSNMIRDLVLFHYRLRRVILVEEEVFENTGTHVLICFFERKDRPLHSAQEFPLIHARVDAIKSAPETWRVSPASHYRAGGEFYEFLQRFRVKEPLAVRYYLLQDEIAKARGPVPVRVVDVNGWTGRGYSRKIVHVSDALAGRIARNPLFVRTLDTGTDDGRAGLYRIRSAFDADAVLVTKSPYRTHPIHLFLEPALDPDEVETLRVYFNAMLEHLRARTHSAFMTTYKYSDSVYTRKYLGLSQVRGLIETFPWPALRAPAGAAFARAVHSQDAGEIQASLRRLTGPIQGQLWH